jgi:hypothetical protein
MSPAGEVGPWLCVPRFAVIAEMSFLLSTAPRLPETDTDRLRAISNSCPEVVPAASWLVYCAEAAYRADVGEHVVGGEHAGKPTTVQVMTWGNERCPVPNSSSLAT